MRNNNNKNLIRIRLIFILLGSITSLIYLNNNIYNNEKITIKFKDLILMNTSTNIKLKSKCYCKSEEELTIKKDLNNYYVQLKLNEKYATQINNELSINEFESLILTCDDDDHLFTMFRRFKHQKIISITINNNNNNSDQLFQLLESFMKQVKHYYPDWIIRIYYKNKLNNKCYFECLKDTKTNEYFDNIDFCLTTTTNNNKYLGILDSFVDYFMFRSVNDLFIMNKNEADYIYDWIEINNSSLIQAEYENNEIRFQDKMWAISKKNKNINFILNLIKNCSFNFNSNDQFYLFIKNEICNK